MSAVRPVAVNKPDTIYSESTVHYGVLMGGPKQIDWEGIGEFSIGHLSIPRRSLAEFTRIQVGRRNESEAAISDDRDMLHGQWPSNPDRVISKTPRACAMDVKETFGPVGFVIPKSLIGKEFGNAVSLFEQVLPLEVAESPLVDVINHLNSFFTTNEDAQMLRNELLSGANISFAYLNQYVGAIKGELELARGTGKGKRGVDNVDTEYFRELRVPLPEEVPALATLAMGKELGAQFAAQANSSKLEEMMAALIESNRLKSEELSLLRQGQLAQTTEPTAKAVSGTTKGK